MSEYAKAFVSEVLIPIAFLSGVWRAIGTSPTTETLNALAQIAQSPYVQNLIQTVGTGMALIFIGGIAASFVFGRFIGLAAFGSAFASGWLVVAAPQLSMYLLVIAMVLAFIAPFFHGGSGGRGNQPAPVRGLR